MGKDDAPQGPDYKKLISGVQKFIDQNQDLFKEAMSFGKEQFSKGQEFVDKMEKFGLDAQGRLQKQADDFTATSKQRVADLEKYGQDWGKAINETYASNKATADKITGDLMPGMGTAAELGGTLLDRYKEQGIPFQDEYIAKLKGWDTTERREDRAAQAVSDINASTEAARESELRRLESYGIDPSQTRSAALDSRLQAANAVAKAQAANQQRQAVEQEGITLGKTASDMYDTSVTAGRQLIDQAAATGKTIADIARQPGADWMEALAGLGSYGLNVGQLEQAAGTTGFNMSQGAEQFGQAGYRDAATQQNNANNYGSGVYDQGGKFISSSANMLNSAYGTSGQLHQGDLAAAEQNNKNSLGGAFGQLAGLAIPAAMSWWNPVAGAAAAGAAAGRSEGGPVDRRESPSRGAIPDDIPAFLDADEYVLDRDTVRWHGVKNLRKLQEDAKKGMGIPDRSAA